MPCSDNIGYASETERRYYANKEDNNYVIDSLQKELLNLKSRNDLLARINCKLINKLTTIFDDTEIKEWWKEHQEFDNNR